MATFVSNFGVNFEPWAPPVPQKVALVGLFAPPGAQGSPKPAKVVKKVTFWSPFWRSFLFFFFIIFRHFGAPVTAVE